MIVAYVFLLVFKTKMFMCMFFFCCFHVNRFVCSSSTVPLLSSPRYAYDIFLLKRFFVKNSLKGFFAAAAADASIHLCVFFNLSFCQEFFDHSFIFVNLCFSKDHQLLILVTEII
jgi:hypothetical protein